METVDFEALKKKAEKLPQASEQLSNNHLYLHCYFNPEVSYYTRKLPDDFSKTSGEVERIVRESFPLEVIGMDSAIPIPQRPTGNVSRYCGFIRAVSLFGVEADILTRAHHIATSGGGGSGYMEACLNMELNLPTDGYLDNTKRVLTGIWSMIRGIEFATPKIPSGGKKANFEPGSILLIRDGKPVATGYPCFRELGLKLEDKDISLIGGYGM